ncbi:Fc.00g077320.m01.CDS01 [Cosmosporella sp. VM-42]
MVRDLSSYDKISIGEIVVYSFFLIGAILLCIKHGITRSAGWRFLIILALARLIGSGMELATINDPTNKNLYIGWLVLNGVGFGPLILMLLGLLSRLFESINRQGHVVVKPLYLRAIQLLMLVAMILLIVGGTNGNYSTVNGKPKVSYPTESKVGVILMVVVLALLIFETFIVFRNQGYISQGEHRILVAVAACLPFVIVRLIYTCYLILGNKSQNVWLYLGAGVIMEMVVALICEVVGFSLQKAPPKPEKNQVELESNHV